MCYFHKKWIFFALFFFLSVSIYQYIAGKVYGPVLFPDEFGYWAPAAWIMGYNWSGAASAGYYYSFGYSFLLLPLMAFIKNVTILYRAAIGLNIVFFLCSFLLLKRVIPFLVEKDYGNIFLPVVVGCLYPAHAFYMQMSLPETLLLMLFLAGFFVIIRYLEKPDVITACVLPMFFLYLFFVHMRSISIGAAAFVIWLIVIYSSREHRKYAVVTLFIGIALATFGIMLKRYFVENIYCYASQELLNVNGFGGQIEKLKKLMSMDGIFRFSINCIGELFYLAVATGGIIFSTFHYLYRNMIQMETRAWKEGKYGKILSLFLLLAFAFQFLISAVFTMTQERLDMVFYGRYNEIFVPIFLVIGILEFEEIKRKDLFFLYCIITEIIASLILIAFFSVYHIEGIYGYFVTGICYLIPKSEQISGTVLVLRMLLTGVKVKSVIILVSCFKNQKWKQLLWGLFAVLEFVTGMYAGERYIGAHNRDNYADICMAEKLREESLPVCFILSDGCLYLDLIQYICQEKSIYVFPNDIGIESLPDRCLLLILQDNERKEQLDRSYQAIAKTSHFIMYDKVESGYREKNGI